jgi:hypothetical protein
MVPLSVVLKYRHRRHQKAMALAYVIALGLIFVAMVVHSVIVLALGFGLAVVTWNVADSACRKQGCRAFARKGR